MELSFEERKKYKPFAILFFIVLGVGLLFIPKEGHSDYEAILIPCTAYGSILFGIIAAFIPVKETEAEIRARERETNYHNALKGTDKAEALRLGRIYYGGLREDRKVTSYDEQAIANDLNTMITNVNVEYPLIHTIENNDIKSYISSDQEILYCPSCGKEYVSNVNNKFCVKCGREL